MKNRTSNNVNPPSDTLCALAWNHSFVSPQGEFKPCCRFHGKMSSKDANLDEFFNGDQMNSIRENMLQNKALSGCTRCYQEESSGKLSLRQRYNKHPSLGLSQVDFSTPKITWLEIPFSNICNIACRMCDSRYSTRWIKDELSLLGAPIGQQRVVSFDMSVLKKMAPTLKHVKVTGGEPFVDPQHTQFLQILLASGNPKQTYLNYSTNLTVYPSGEVLSMWKELERVELALSLDAILPQDINYIRYPSHGETVLENVKKFLSLAAESDNIHLILRTTVSVLNVFQFPEILAWWYKQKLEKIPTHLLSRVSENPTHLSFPSYLSPQILSSSLKEELKQTYKTFLEQNSQFPGEVHLQYILNHALEADLNDQALVFAQKTKALDSIRNQNFLNTFPRLSELNVL